MAAIIPIIILIFFSSLLFFAHWVVYISLVSFFGLKTLLFKRILLAVLAFLSVSFIGASTIAALQENVYTRALYFISGFWLGLLTNLVLAFGLVWCLVWASATWHWTLPIDGIAIVLTLLALVISCYGTVVALRPVVTEVTVRIPGLPEAWRGKKIVQLSDVHIGHIYQRDFLVKVVQEVNALHPEMVVITGDLFDGMDGVLESAIQPLNDIQAPHGIYYVTGNHETYLGVERALAAIETTPVHILDDEVVDVDGLKVIGIDYPKRGEKKSVPDVLRALAPQFAGQPNIYLYHSPVNISVAREVGVNLQLSGHTHQGQLWPFRYITSLIFHGYDYGLYPEGNYTLYTSSGTGSWGPAMRTGTVSEIVAITLE
jgi:predicted MPP superfamily phosphohydrolase